MKRHSEEKFIKEIKSLNKQIQDFAIIKEEAKQAKIDSRESKQIIERIINVVPARIFWKDKNLVFMGCNEIFARDAGYTDPEEIIGKDDFQMVWRDQAELYRNDDRQVIESGRSKILIEEPQTTPEGKTITNLTNKIPLRNSQGEIIGVLGTYMDITERKQAEKEIYLYGQALKSINEAVYIADMENKIIYINEAFTNIYGYTREEMIGKTIEIIRSAKNPSEVIKEILSKTMAGGWQGELLNRRKDGGEFPIFLSTSVVLDDKGESMGFVGTAVDITDRVRAKKELQNAKETAEALTRLKSDFLANMSHEIRTPMNGVIGMTGLLMDTELTNQQREYAEMVKISAESLLTIINDILDFSKIGADKIELEILDFDLRTTLEDLNDMMAISANRKGLELVLFIDPDVPSLLQGDPGRLRQVLTNLMSNAIKFTQHGEVALLITLESEKKTEATIHFAVRDTGIGIPANKVNGLFEAFTQADVSTTRKFGGTGLGLSITKSLVELMGGQIGVDSETGKGSTFWFTVSLKKQTAQKKLEQTIKSEIPSSLAGTRILAVDDNDTNRKVLAGMLTSWKCEYDLASDAQSAFDKLKEAADKKTPYQIAILDMLMPEINGATLGKMIKANRTIKETALVMMTSAGERGDAERLKKAGFTAYLTKPVKQSQIYNCLITILGQKTNTKILDKPIITRHSIADDRKQKIRIMLAEDNIINQKVALKILENLGYHADAVANGKEALNALETLSYDLVLMDVQMPEMDGFEATKKIRDSESAFRNLPVIAMTAQAMKGDREKCLKAGMDDYVSKPVRPQELEEVIKKWT